MGECLFDIREGPLPGGAQAVYRTKDFYLIYEIVERHPGGRRVSSTEHGKLFVIADTVTLTFDSSTLRLTEIDAFTFSERWVQSLHREPPRAKATGSLCLSNPPSDDDRMTMHVKPRVERASDDAWLRIVFVDEEDAEYYDVAPDLRVGLRSGVLCDAYFLSVRLE